MRAHSTISAVIAGLAVIGCGPAGPGPPADEGPDAAGQLECFDADYPIEPTFTTAEEALEHAVTTEGAAMGAVAAPEEYERVERADGWIDFAFDSEGQGHHTWGITRDEDGQWGMTSLGGCSPAAP